MSDVKKGGCQCGRVRYRADVSEAAAYLCHCKMCQKATGGFAATFVFLPVAAVEWQSEPDWYASSPIAKRPFCLHEAWLDTSDLPRQRSEETDSIVKRWKAAGMEVPE